MLVHDPVYVRVASIDDHKSWAAVREDSWSHLTAWEDRWPSEDLNLSAFRLRLRRNDKRIRQGSALPMLIFRQSDHQLVGGVTASNFRFGAARAATLGYWVGRSFTRRGYGRAAILALLSHLFETLELNRVEAACQPENLPSKSLLKACGFQYEGVAREYLLINGKWRDHEIYALTASDFAAQDGALT